MSVKLTTGEFISKSKLIHKNTYNYDYVNYINGKTKVDIECKMHGVFSQTPENHLRGNGCPECGKLIAGHKLRNTYVKFMTMAKKIHGDIYDYKKVIYKNAHEPVIIICATHGEFNQTYANHIHNKQGCPKCGNIKKIRAKPQTYFLEQVKLIHPRYDYSKTHYTNNSTKVEIICPEHGSFWQLPTNHLNLGHGCPKCATSGFNQSKDATLYYLYDSQEELYKIGITNKTLTERFGIDFLKNRKAEILMEEYYPDGQKAYLAEQEILQAFNGYRQINNSWPESKGGKTEFFNKDILNLRKDQT
jgi:Zn finger protein HypA/HybF involved in hydrogenase expression